MSTSYTAKMRVIACMVFLKIAIETKYPLIN